MRLLLRYEWSKPARLPALWGFLALCLAFNCLLIGNGDRWRWEWNEAGAVADELGQQVNQDFLDGLEQHLERQRLRPIQRPHRPVRSEERGVGHECGKGFI